MYTSNWTALGPQQVLALKKMDHSRQERGKMLERSGHGPRETPSTVILAETGLQLRRYDPAHAGGPAVLLVPAPIKRAYIWDLAPAISVVQRWQERGYRVYLAEWLPRPDGNPDVGLAEYGDRMLSSCQRAIDADCGQGQLTIAGHSLGGILAAIYSAMHPERVTATVLLEAPLRFDHPACCFAPLVNATVDARHIAETFRHVPGAFLNMMSALAEPQAFQFERMTDRWLSLFDPTALATHMQVERWTHDEFPLPGKLFVGIVESLYRNDDFMKGRLDIDGRSIGPADLRAPLISVVDPRSKVIPPDAVVPFHDATSSSRKQVLEYHGDIGVNLQHVGVLVGRNAHATLWPAIFDLLGAPALPAA